MKKTPLVLAVVAGIFMSESARADAIPYANPGTPVFTTYNFNSGTFSGTEYLTVYGTTAADFHDALYVSVGGGAYTYTGVHNAPFSTDPSGKTLAGFTYSFNVTAGQSINFELAVDPDGAGGGPKYYSNLVDSNNYSHVYSTAFSGGNGIGPGIYIGFEDQGISGVVNNSGELNYTDIQVVLSQVAPVPELSTWAMMMLGFAGLGFLGYRRSQNRLMAMESA